MGRDLSQVENLVNRFLDLSLERMLNPAVLLGLKEAQNQKEYVVLLSSSPDFLVKEIARRLQIDHWGATEYRINHQGIFTTLGLIMEGENKARFIQELNKEKKFSYSDITVFSDSHLDLPLLNLAGKVIAVNPDSRLKRICQQRNWEVLI